jgi:hypothetical protein
MICGHCKSRTADVQHVKACAQHEASIRSIGGYAEQAAAYRAKKAVFVPLTVEPVEGIYVHEGNYYKVVQASTTDRWYASEWDQDTNGGAGSWQYLGRGPLHFLGKQHRVTAEQAAAWGHLTGVCVFCTRRLTDARSIEVGYGPVCAARESLPWGELTGALDGH